MRIAVVGATGRTGRLVIEQALGRGHAVVALARHPEAVQLADTRLRVVAGDVLDRESLAGSFDGCDAVISALGVGTSRAATEVYSAGTANVLAEMSAAGTSRLAVISAYPAGPREHRPGLGDRIVGAILWRFFGATYTDMQRMEKILQRSDAQWVALRPPRLIDKPPTGSYRIGSMPPPGGRSLRYGDLATALLDVLDRREFFRTAVYVTN
jgi:putative NADH-flavin reductase